MNPLRKTMLIALGLLGFALAGCMSTSTSTMTSTQPVWDEKGNVIGVKEVPTLRRTGAATARSGARYDSAGFTVDTQLDPHTLALDMPQSGITNYYDADGRLTSVSLPGASGRLALQGIGRYRMIAITKPKNGDVQIALYGGDDLTIGEVQATEPDGASFSLFNLGATISSVEQVATAQLEIVMGEAFTTLAKEEKEAILGQVTALVEAGKSVAEAVAEVAIKALAPVPLP